MTLISRRAALCGIASIPATGGAGAAFAAAGADTPPLPAVERARQAAEALAIAMDDWMAELDRGRDSYSHWIAHVHPASVAEYPVMFENAAARRAPKAVQS